MNKHSSPMFRFFLNFIVLLAIFCTPCRAQINPDGSKTLLGHVPKAVSISTLKSHVDPGTILSLHIVLPQHHQAQLDQFLKDLNDPTNPNYHKYLTPAQFARVYGASQVEAKQVKEYLVSQGFSLDAQQPSSGLVIKFHAPVNTVESNLALHINNYVRNDNGQEFFAPDANPTIPIQLANKIVQIHGLNNAVIPSPMSHLSAPHSSFLMLHKNLTLRQESGITSQVSTSTGPSGSLAPAAILSAYNFNAIPVSGNRNITYGLYEMDGYNANDITQYETQFGLTHVPLQNVLVDGFNGAPLTSGGQIEDTIDIELAEAFAPQLSKIMVYETPNASEFTWFDQWLKIVDDNLVQVVSCSWAMNEDQEYDSDFENEYIFQQMASQGISVFVASGDSGSNNFSGVQGVLDPADQDYVTAVGTTQLTFNGNAWSSETASSSSGGGISWFLSIPSYQTMANLPKTSSVSSTYRNVPDVALSADATTPYEIYVSGNWGGVWGSSLSSPVWAAFAARVDQGLMDAGKPVIGLLNPYLYAIAANSSQYASAFHQITTGSNGAYKAGPGLNNVTGLGSLNADNLYNLILASALQATAPSAPILSAASGNSLVTLTWSAGLRATSYNVMRSTLSGGPYSTVVATGIKTTSYIDRTAVSWQSYYYVVTALNTSGTSGYSNEASAMPETPPASAPTLVERLINGNQILLTWNPIGIYTTSIIIKRATVNNGPYNTIATIGVYPFMNAGYTDTSAFPGQTYYYVVTFNNTAGPSPYSNQVSVTLAPLAPTELFASPGQGQVSLTWNASQGATSYYVQRGTTNGGPYGLSVAPSITSTSFTDYTASSGTTYYYVVIAANAGGYSSNSNQTSAIPSPAVPPVAAPIAPTGLTATAGNGQVALSWTASPGATSYTVKRGAVNGGPYSTSVSSGSTTTSYDTKAVNGTTYYYVVTASNTLGTSSNSNQASAKPQAGAPPMPTGLTATASNGQVVLSWAATSGATTYNVLRATANNGPYETSLATGLTAKTFTDYLMGSNGITYYYVVTAQNANGTSWYSNQASATSIIVVSPDGSTLTAPSSKSLIDQAGNTWSFGTLNTGDKEYNVMENGQAINTGMTMLIWNQGILYGYGAGTWYLPACVYCGWFLDPRTIAPFPPTSVSAAAGSTSALVTFSGALANAGPIKSYTVTSNPGNYKATGPSSPITVGGLTPGQSYTFTVTATNKAGTGGASPASNSITPTGAITIMSQPADTSVFIGSSATLSVVATPAPLTYQWYYSNGTEIYGATASSYLTPSNLTLGTYSYYVVVSNTIDSVTSSTATLTVTMPPLKPAHTR